MQKYRLTYPQKNIWLVEEFNKNLPINSIVGTIEINKDFDAKICNEAINNVIKNNDAMRISVLNENDEVIQFVNKFKYKNFEVVELSLYSEEKIKEYINECVLLPLFLDKNELYEFKILDYGNGKGAIFMKVHHIISDAWSCGKIGSQLIEYIEKLLNNEALEDVTKPSYVEFINSEIEYEKSLKYEKDKNFWNEYLDGIEEPISLNKNTELVNSLNTSAKRYTVKLEESINERINKYCKENRISPYALFLASLATYIYRIKDEKDIVLGTPVLNRSNFKEKQILGMFVATMPIRIKVEENISFLELAKKISSNTLEIFRHQKYPYFKILEDVHENTKIKSNLYNIILSYQNARTDVIDSSKYSTTWPFVKNITDELQIHIMDMDASGILNINYDYKTSIFDEIYIKYLHTRIMSIIENAIEDINIDIEKIDIMSKEEKTLILNSFNSTKTDYPTDSSIVELFKEQVALNPKKDAISFENKKITYEELDKKSNQLANYLSSIEFSENASIGIFMDKSIEMLVSIIAILKCGLPYLPIDKSYPSQRISYMLNDSNCNTVITDKKYEEVNLNSFELDKINIVDVNNILDSSKYTNKVYENESNIKYLPNDIVYIMYTSGTTGKPKGVCVTNRNIIRLVKNTNYIEFKKEDVILQTGSIVFDASTFEFWGALLNGLTLSLISKEDLLNPAMLESKITENNISVLWLTAPLFNQMVDYNPNMFRTLRILLVGGDVLSVKHINIVKKACPNLQIINGYGPTENTTFSTYFKIDKVYNKSIPIGYPISNSTCYVVDKKNRLLPIMVEGELLVGGDGVSKGYLNNEKLTNEKFIKDIYNKENKMAYKTGDIVYFNENGEIEFIGRKDYQFKIRGFRIELGEIQKAIISLKHVKDAFVVVNKENLDECKIYAYYTLNDKSIENNIREDLKVKLPEYMIPNFFICVENIPLNQNGKVDKQKLIKENKILKEKENIVNSAYTKIQETITKIINSTLGIQNIDVKESLFSYGIDSLSAIRLAIEISKKFDVEISAKDVFLNNTVEKLEIYIKQYQGTKKDISVDENEIYPLTDAQIGVFVETSKNNKSLSYNIPFELVLNEKYNIEYVREYIQKVIKKHKVLFTKIIMQENDVYQKIDEVNFNVDIKENLSLEQYEKYREQFVKPFDLLKDILFRVSVCSVENKIYVLFDIHHIIFDGISIFILINDILKSLNNEEIEVCETLLGKKALLEKENKKSKEYNIAKQAMINKFSGQLPISQIPYDKNIISQNSNKFSESLYEEFYIDGITKQAIEKYSRLNNITLNNIFLGMFFILLSKYSYNDEILLAMANQGRTTEEELNSIGMFVKTLPIKYKIEYKLDINEYLKSVQNEVLDTINNDFFTYKDLVSSIVNKKEYYNNIIKTMFIYQNIGNDLKYFENKLSLNELNTKVAKFDLTCQVIPSSDNIKIKLEFAKNMYNKSTIKRFGKEYVHILKKFGEYVSSNCALKEIEIIDENEKNILLNKFNDTNTDYPKDLAISQVFEKEVQKHGQKIALILKDKKISYNELNENANRFARYLKDEQKVIKNQVIALIADKSFEMIIGILGILKSGACYLPIDINLPQDRIKYMINNSKSSVVINCSNENLDFLNQDELNKIRVINMKSLDLKKYNCTNLENINTKTDRAYIMYTSGSTGKPKGCINTHRGVIKLVKDINYLDIDSVENVFLSGNLVFDASLHEMWICLLNGKTGVIINKEEVLTPSIYKNYFESYKNVLAIFTTQLFHQYAQSIPEMFKNAKYVLCGGDVLLYQYVENVKKCCAKTNIINIYGPAECSAAATTLNIDESFKGGPIPIGKPMSNTKCYVLDSTLNLCPINVEGELYIGGEGVGKGYINNLELTNKSFIDNNIDNSSEKIYKTGDIVKWNEKGLLEFLGRKDNQIKIRGYRVEVAEIENIALKNDGIDEIKIVVKKNKLDKQLVMYFTANKKIDISELKNNLFKKLPKYMVPEYLIQIDKMPLNINGKIDEKMLPDIKEVTLSKEYINPRNEIELKLKKVICKLLNLKECSVTENLFNIGLDSINTTRFCVELMNQDINITYSDVFEYPTIEKLANLVNAKINPNDNYNIEEYDYTNINNLLSKEVVLKKTSISNVKDILITGVNGFLGAHVLAQFLDNCNGISYCVVRKIANKTGEERLKTVLNYYFKDKYDDIFDKRIKVIDVEISSQKFEEQINEIIPNTNINRIINCAAKVKHFGKKEEFYKLNVESTKKLINICIKNNVKLIHISTLSVSGNGIEGGFTSQKLDKQIDFTEKDLYVGQKLNNVYSYSKFLAEREILEKVCTKGLDASVIRVGNLMGRYSDGKFQRNKSDNAFIDRIKFLLDNKFISKEIVDNNYIELSPVDLVANVIMNISSFEKCSYIYHVYNYNHYSIEKFLEYLKNNLNIEVKVLKEKEFYDKLNINIKNNINTNLTIMSDLNSSNKLDYSSNINIKHDLTEKMLESNNFKWNVIDDIYLNKFFEGLNIRKNIKE